jgi:hypothetical protein
MDCDHIGKVIKEGYNLVDGQMHSVVFLWGCTRCDATSEEPLYDISASSSVIKIFCEEDCECFGCKAKGLQMNAGDARGDVNASGTTQKKWNSELDAYRNARAQGIQPNGTKRKQIEAAHDASERLGTAYDGNTMVQAQKLDKKTAHVMKELKEAGIK